MKNLVITVSLIFTASLYASVSSANCNLSLYQTKSGAKTFYTTNGERLSLSNVTKLKNVCKIDVKLASEAMKKSLKIKRLEASLAKLKK